MTIVSIFFWTIYIKRIITFLINCTHNGFPPVIIMPVAAGFPSPLKFAKKFWYELLVNLISPNLSLAIALVFIDIKKNIRVKF